MRRTHFPPHAFWQIDLSMIRRQPRLGPKKNRTARFTWKEQRMVRCRHRPFRHDNPPPKSAA